MGAGLGAADIEMNRQIHTLTTRTLSLVGDTDSYQRHKHAAINWDKWQEGMYKSVTCALGFGDQGHISLRK